MLNVAIRGLVGFGLLALSAFNLHDYLDNPSIVALIAVFFCGVVGVIVLAQGRGG